VAGGSVRWTPNAPKRGRKSVLQGLPTLKPKKEDPTTIEGLEEAKVAAVEIEDFREASRLKKKILKIKATEEIEKYQKLKKEASVNEDYAKAKEYKALEEEAQKQHDEL